MPSRNPLRGGCVLRPPLRGAFSRRDISYSLKPKQLVGWVKPTSPAFGRTDDKLRETHHRPSHMERAVMGFATAQPILRRHHHRLERLPGLPRLTPAIVWSTPHTDAVSCSPYPIERAAE